MTTLLTILLFGCGGSGGNKEAPTKKVVEQCAGQDLLTGNECVSINDRDAIVYQPSSQVIEGVALFLHGAPGNASKVMGIFDAKSIADTYNLIALSPNGIISTWGWLSVNNQESDNTDINYLNELLIQVKGNYGVTSDKLYIFGYSAGGFMAYKLACVMPEQISGVISLAGQFRGSLDDCSNSTPVNIHHFHNETDQEVPFDGLSTGYIMSVEQTIEHWRQKNGCDETFVTTEQAGVTDSSYGTTTEFYDSCDKTVALSKMINVAHESNYMSDKLHDIYKYLLIAD
ncbi:PHB depolymerase family esterase [Colwelliaceae bacterium 6471]